MNKFVRLTLIILIGIIAYYNIMKISERERDTNEEIIPVLVENINKSGIDTSQLMQTLNIGNDQLWVEVSLLNDKHRVFVRKGDTLIREMPCSGGTADEPTVTGTFYLENRGEWFYSERFNEGALYWVRFYEQYLFHSVPVDRDFNVIQEELDKLGKAASHGCIRLLEEDAKWFYENVPDGTLVYIYYE